MNLIIKKYFLTFILISMVISFYKSTSLAYSIKSNFELSNDSELQKVTTYSCQQGDDFCSLLCQNDNICKIKETYCEDCLSIKQQYLKLIFDSSHTIYSDLQKNIKKSVFLQFLLTHKYFLVSYDSVINIYNPEENNANLVRFRNICQNQSSNNYLILEINTENKSIESIPAVICQNSENNSEIFPVEFEFSNDPQLNHKYWAKIYNSILDSLKNSQLKLDQNLN